MAGSKTQHELIVEIAGKVSSTFGKALGKANKQVAAFGKFAAGAAKMTAVGMAAAATAGVAVAGASINVGKAFESQMSAVGAIAGNVSDEELQAVTDAANGMGLAFEQGANATETSMNILEAKAEQMGATTQFSATEAGEAMEYMAMAGWKGADMVQGIDGIMNLAAASGEDLASTSDIVTDALTAFGMTAEDSGEFADVLAAASSNANTNVAMLGESFKYVAPVAGALGYSAKDTSLALGIMANSGIKASQAGNALKTSLARMAAPTDKQAAAMEELGLTLTDSEGNMKDLRSVMTDIRAAIGSVGIELADAEGNARDYDSIMSELSQSAEGMSKAQQVAAASTIFGKESMAGMLAIANASEADFNKLAEAIDDSSGAAARMAAIRLDNLDGDVTLLKSGLEGLGIKIYKGMNVPLREAAQAAIGYVEQMNAAFQEGGFEGLVKAIGDCPAQAVSAIASRAPQVVSMGVSLISSFVQGIVANADSLADAAAEAASVFIDGLFTVLPQVLLAGIDIITKLADGIVSRLPALIQNGALAIANFVNGIIQRLPDIISAALALVQTLVDGIAQNAPMLINAAIRLIGNLVMGIISMLPQLMQMGIQLVLSLAQGLIANLPLILQIGVEAIKNLISGIVQMLPMVIQGGAQLLVSLVQGINFNIGNILQAGMELVGALASGLIQAIPEILAVVPRLAYAIADGIVHTDWLQVGVDIITSILKGFLSMGKSVWDAISGLFTGKAPDLSLEGMEAASSYVSGFDSGAKLVTSPASSMFADASSMEEYASSMKMYASGMLADISSIANPIDLNKASEAGTAAGKAVAAAATAACSTGLADGLNGATLDVSGMGMDTTALAANLSAAGQESGAAFTAALDSSISRHTLDASGIGVGTAGLDSSFAAAGAAGAEALGSGVADNAGTVAAAAGSLATGVSTALDAGWNAAKDSAGKAIDELADTVKGKAQAAARAVKSAFENMKIKVPRPQLPRISVSYATQGSGDAQAKIPQFAVSYYAAGGIMKSPTLFGMVGGERGPEGIIPLNPFWDRLDSGIAEALAGNTAGMSRASQDAAALVGMNSQTAGAGSIAKQLYNEIANSSTENVSNYNNTAESSPKIVYSPQITIQGSADREDIQSALSMSQDEFKRMVDEYIWQNGRTAMAT